MALSRLDDDTFSLVLSMLKQSALLALALTSRSMRNRIIPRFLFAHVVLPCNSPEKLRAFFDCVMAKGSMAGSAVRHLEIDTYNINTTGFDYSFADALCKLGCLRSLVVKGLLEHLLPQSSGTLVLFSMTDLQSIDIRQCTKNSLGLIRDLRRLRRIRITSPLWTTNSYERPTIAEGSALADILLNSRETLEELSLTIIPWKDDFSRSLRSRNLSFDNLHTLSLNLLSLNDIGVDLTYLFPSARFVSLIGMEGGESYRVADPCSHLFLSRLESLKGALPYLQAAVVAGARLFYADIRCNASFTPADFSQSIRSLRLTLSFDFRADILDHLPPGCSPTYISLYQFCISGQWKKNNGFVLFLSFFMPYD